ncbi:retrotransposon protein, putative, ty1-copia subclass [Tanacetum coccineum]|uniref:Retrotransposon protein, putative, ty1-copia subclass n=1 Tax=Tanacetum coccineum TaxID=301880 RepID=A0ABQ5AY97_9ASTR
MLQDVISYLGRCFAMKDLGEATYILGIKIYRDRSWRLIGLCQSAYIEKILKRFHMENSKRGSIPIQEKLRLSKSQGALSLYVGNGQRTAVEEIGSFHLCLLTGLVIVLNNCHYAPSITRGIISVSRLYDDGYVNRFVDNTIQVSRNNMVYCSAILKDGIFEIDLSNPNTNDSFMYAISNKRAKLNLDSALLWHCHLGHISNKRIEKLQHDGLLNLTDLGAFEKCVPCMSRKMARKPYTHQVERAKDLLGLIHTDVCGPFKIVDKEQATLSLSLTTLVVMGCEALVKRDTLTKPDKLEPKSIKCIFVGYPKKTMCYSFYYPPENKVLVAQNVEFLENSLITQEASGSLEDLEIIQEEDTHPSSTHCLHLDEVVLCFEIGKMDGKTASSMDFLLRGDSCIYSWGIKIYRAIDLAVSLQEKLKMSNSNRAFTNSKLRRMQNVPYASAVGSIMYAVRCNIKRELRVSCNSDTGYLTDADDLKSQTGYVFILNAEIHFWAGVVTTIKEPINMYCDNTGAITIANESGITKGTRHFRAKVYYLHEVIEYGGIKLEKVHTDDNLADPFTKALAFPKHSEHTKNIEMLPASSVM